ncbi:hypothetical protein GNP93_16620 [Paenibacillus validus]|uniref:GP-PDE domain-containing protein n=1 Tax=Paenibacillus validus TaxID=44253 RepID=A0A7X3CU22_9BACL|nr:hypothetical protein [Paenibacillus validus]
MGRGYNYAGVKPSPGIALQSAEQVVTDNIQENTLLNIDFNAITPELVSYAKHRGLPIYAYTVETKKDMQDLMKMGLPGIITDYANWMETR